MQSSSSKDSADFLVEPWSFTSLTTRHSRSLACPTLACVASLASATVGKRATSNRHKLHARRRFHLGVRPSMTASGQCAIVVSNALTSLPALNRLAVELGPRLHSVLLVPYRLRVAAGHAFTPCMTWTLVNRLAVWLADIIPSPIVRRSPPPLLKTPRILAKQLSARLIHLDSARRILDYSAAELPSCIIYLDYYHTIPKTLLHSPLHILSFDITHITSLPASEGGSTTLVWLDIISSRSGKSKLIARREIGFPTELSCAEVQCTLALYAAGLTMEAMLDLSAFADADLTQLDTAIFELCSNRRLIRLSVFKQWWRATGFGRGH
jgi:hypothetical protein